MVCCLLGARPLSEPKLAYCQHIKTATKWPPCYKCHFQIHFQWKLWISIKFSLKCVPWDLVWTNDELVWWRKYAPLGLSALTGPLGTKISKVGITIQHFSYKKKSWIWVCKTPVISFLGAILLRYAPHGHRYHDGCIFPGSTYTLDYLHSQCRL